MMATTYDSLWDIGAIDIDAQPINRLGDIVQGKKIVLVVNVASLSDKARMNYTSLMELYNRYEAQGFEILAFPCNQFGKQEPLSESEIKKYA